jgi:acyl-CoA thioester hydrolase
MEPLVTYRGTVYPWHCDHMGHMNVTWYVSKFDEASWQLLAYLGLTMSRFRGEGIGMASVEQHLDYKRELHAGDVISVRSSVLYMSEKSIRIRHDMTNDDSGELVATTVIVGVHLDTTTRRARVFPADVRERATFMMGEGQCASHN